MAGDRSKKKKKGSKNLLGFAGGVVLPFVLVFLAVAKVERHGPALNKLSAQDSVVTQLFLTAPAYQIALYAAAGVCAILLCMLQFRGKPGLAKAASWAAVLASMAGIVSIYLYVISPAERVVEALSR